MNWIQILMIVWFALGAGATLASIDKPRDPITPGLAVGSIVVTALMILGVIFG